MSIENELDRFPVRKNPRLRNFDYSSRNHYFVTICTRDKRCLFGDSSNLSQNGIVAEECLREIEQHFFGITLDKWVIMPNHIHAIVALSGNSASLSTIIGQYKSAVTNKLRTTTPGLNVWQSSFHDHVIRNQTDYQRIWAYIDANPARWMEDCFYTPQPDL